MSDIVERLHSYGYARAYNAEPIIASELHRAADEIIALRAQVAALTAELAKARDRIIILEALCEQ